ncbi:MAG TPA: tetratricopeptide repeat protein [Candidatus Obscuribacterales bacterium]
MQKNEPSYIPIIIAILLLPPSCHAAGADDPGWVRLKNKGSQKEVFGDYIAAEEYYRQALKNAEMSNASSAQITELVLRLAIVLVTQKKVEEAEPLYQRALKAAPSLKGDTAKNEDVMACYDALAETYMDRIHGPRRPSYLRHAINIFDTAFDGSHPRLVNCLFELGEIQSRFGQYEEARKNLRRAAHLCDPRTPKSNRKLWLRTVAMLASVYSGLGDHKKSLELYQMALGAALKGSGREAGALGPLYCQLAVAYYNNGKKEEGTHYARLAEALLMQMLKEEERKKRATAISSIQLQLAYMDFNFGNYERAANYCRQAIALIESESGKTDSSLIGALEMLKEISKKQHKNQDAAMLEKRVKDIKKLYAVNRS